MTLLTGILPVLPTPFTDDLAIDPAAMARVVDFSLQAGVHGIVFPGFASEVDDLDAAERRTLLSVVVERVAGRVPIVAGASSGSADEAIARCEEARALGVTTVMIQAPKSVGRDAASVGAFYRAIAAASPGIDIILQNAPAPRGSDLAAGTILAIAGELPAIRYVKEESLPSGPPISALLAGLAQPGKATELAGVMGGGGARYLIDELQRGACAAMPAAELADVHVRLFAAWQAGDLARARAIYQRTLPLLLIQALYRMRLTKYVLMRRGVLANDAVRAAIPPFDAHDRAGIDAWIDEIARLFNA